MKLDYKKFPFCTVNFPFIFRLRDVEVMLNECSLQPSLPFLFLETGTVKKVAVTETVM